MQESVRAGSDFPTFAAARWPGEILKSRQRPTSLNSRLIFSGCFFAEPLMQLGLLMALVAAIVISENVPHEPVPAVTLRLVLVLASNLAVVLLAAMGSVAIARAIDQDSRAPLHVAPLVRPDQAGASGRVAVERRVHALWTAAGRSSCGTTGDSIRSSCSRTCSCPGADLGDPCCFPGPPSMKWTMRSIARLCRQVPTG